MRGARGLRGAVAIAIAAILLQAPAFAGPITADMAARLAAIGAIVDPPRTAGLYAPLHPREPYEGVRVTRDLFYGPAPRNRVDVFEPAASSTRPRPVLLFVHGGGFVRGDKRSQAGFAWDNVALWAARNGFVGAIMTYRLASDAPWPAGPEDIGMAVRWLAREIASRGGDPKRIVLMGHSAGAVHAASYVAMPRLHGPDGSGIAAAILASGLYDLSLVDQPDERAYFGVDPTDRKAKSPLAGLLSSPVPILFTAAALDPPHFVKQFELLTRESCARPAGCFASAWIAGHNHLLVAYSIGTDDTSLTDPILAFIKTIPGPPL